MEVALGEAKNRLSELVSEAERVHKRVIITRHGKAAAMLIGIDDFASLEETYELTATPGALAELEQAKEDVCAGRVFTAEQLAQKYLRNQPS